MKKQVLLTLLGIIGLSSGAMAQQDYLCLYSRNQADSQSWNIEQVRKITFTATGVEVFLRQGETPYALGYDNVRKFTFEEQALPTSIPSTEAEEHPLRYDAARRTFLVGARGGNGTLLLYGINGVQAWSTAVTAQQLSYPLPPLPPGIYIARLTDGRGTTSLKLQIK